MSKKQEKKDKDVLRSIKICVLDDAPNSSKQIEQLMRLNTRDDFKFNIWRSSDLSDIHQHWKDAGPFDAIIVDISFASHHGVKDAPLEKSFLDKFLRQHNKTRIIFYSKSLPDTWSLANLKHKADVLCVGPDAQQNTSLAARRALEAIFKKFNRHSTELSKRWESFSQLSETKRKGMEFESICAMLLAEVEGFDLTSDKPKDWERQADLVVENKNTSDFWIQSLGSPILVECKLSKSPRLMPTLYELIGRLTVARSKTGILFLASTLSEVDRRDISKITKAASADGRHILVIDGTALEAVINGEYPDTALKLAYFSTLAEK